MLKILNKALIFIIVNVIGYFAVLTLFALLILKFDVLNYGTTTINKVHFEQTYFIRSFLSWGISAIFSLTGLFLKSPYRFAFLLAPIFIPLIIGIITILTAA